MTLERRLGPALTEERGRYLGYQYGMSISCFRGADRIYTGSNCVQAIT